jgi:predicted dehydrogenase
MALINEPQFVSARRHSPYAPRILTGVAWDLLIHDVDLALRVFGENPQQTQGSLSFVHPHSRVTSEDNAEATLNFSQGRLAQVSASRISQRKIRELSIYELDRLIEVDLLRRDVTVYRHVSDQPADTEGRGYKQQTVIEIPELVSGVEPLAAQLIHFSELLRGNEDPEAEIDSLVGPHRTVSLLKEA